jgi:NhaC family Na+:H+ antiporter
MISYGLKFLSPGIFLIATLLICSIVSLGTGSSWSTAGTVGVALMGVGKGLGIPGTMVAGAIVSGAYFGDKMSPLSDTTNLAPAVAGTDLFSHIRHMMYTTIPAYLLCFPFYGIIGSRFAKQSLELNTINSMLNTIDNQFLIHPVLLVPPVLVIFMVIRRMPALPALIAGTALGCVCALLFQSASLAEVLNAAHSGYVSQTGVDHVDTLLTRGGLMNMMETVALIICALSFGGVMEKTGMLEKIASFLISRVKRPGSLIATTLLSSAGMNAIASNQYMSIVIPGRMFQKAFHRFNLHPKNLSRCLEDSGTLTSPLIPWNSCGAFMHATLGVSPLAFIGFAFFNIITPVISAIYGYAGISIEKQ